MSLYLYPSYFLILVKFGVTELYRELLGLNGFCKNRLIDWWKRSYIFVFFMKSCDILKVENAGVKYMLCSMKCVNCSLFLSSVFLRLSPTISGTDNGYSSHIFTTL